MIQRHLSPDRWYRLRVAPRVFAHVTGVYNRILAGFDEHVPLADSIVPVRAASPNGLWLPELTSRTPLLRRRRGRTAPRMLGHVPGRDLRTMIARLARSQMPGHDPTHEPLPTWADDGHAAYGAGDDITTYTGAHL